MTEPRFIGDAVSSGIQRSLHALEALAPCICSDNTPDDLHDFRVAARRARSQLSVFAAWLNPKAQAALLKQLKDLAARTDELRDLDVLLGDLESLSINLPPALQPGINTLNAALHERRLHAYSELRSHLASTEFPAYLQKCRELSVCLTHEVEPAEQHAVAYTAVPTQILKAQERTKKLAQSSDDAALHKLRIAGKKLRYMLDFLNEELPDGKSRRARKVLKAAHDELGRFHDRDVQQTYLTELLGTLPTTPENTALSQTLCGILAMLHLQKKHMAKKAYKHADDAFCGPEIESLRRALTKAANNKA